MVQSDFFIYQPSQVNEPLQRTDPHSRTAGKDGDQRSIRSKLSTRKKRDGGGEGGEKEKKTACYE